MEDIILLNVFKTLKNSFFSLILTTIAIALSVITIIDVTNDTTVNAKSFLNEDNVQYEIRKNETIFRDLIYKKIDSIYLDKTFIRIDSVTLNSSESNEIKQYLLFNKLKNSPLNYSIDIPIKKSSSPLIELESIVVFFEIDLEKLSDILKLSKNDLLLDNIKYGNFLKTKYEYNKRIRYEYIIIGLFILISIFVVNYFRKRIGKNNNKVEDTIESLISDKEAINLAHEILQDDKIEKKEIEKLKKLVDQIKDNLYTYEFESILHSILYVDMIKSERKSTELYNRSTLMLILGLLIALLGVVIFYLTLPEFKGESNPMNYLSLTIRPTFILIFIQSIAFYLLKQYRSLIQDYKYFHEDYLKKSQNFVTYQLMQNDNLKEIELKLIDKLLSENDNEKIRTQDLNVDKLANEKLVDILKLIIEKIN